MTATVHTTKAKASVPHTKAPPPVVNTPEERKKFVILVGLAFIVVALIWIATLPINFKQTGPTAPGPTTVFGVITEKLGAVSRIGDMFHQVKEANQSQ